MRKIFAVLFIVLLAIFTMTTQARAQAYPGSQASLLPNYAYPVATFTAASQNGSTLYIGGLTSGVITVYGTALTTATWKIQGSNDGGGHWFDLPTAAYPTTAAPTTLAVSQTSTATGLFAVNLAGFTNVRFATTSGTFTATSLSLVLTGSSNKGYL